ncbi:MAG: glycosyltransferase family 4 protein, partial [Gammaproteobacteria bacterium]
ENLIAGVCHSLKKTRPVFVITSYAGSAVKQEDWIFRPSWPGLLPFFVYALCQGFVLLRREPNIKVVLGGSPLVAPVVLILARLLGRKAIALVHGSDLIYSSALYQLLCVRWLRRCDRIIANSRFTASLAEQKKVPPDSICVIPPGLHPERFVPDEAKDAREAFGLESKKVILYAGRLARRKGVKEFIENSLPRIVAEIPETCFVIAGDNPTESLIHRDDVMEELKTAVLKSGLKSHVRLLGWLRDGDLPRIYQACDVMVLPVIPVPGDVEGFGIVLLEAAAAGKPAVATRAGGIPDAVEDGRSGILVDPEDYEMMVRTIVRVLRDDQMRSTLGEYARARAVQSFSWETIIRRYEALFDSLGDKECR